MYLLILQRLFLEALVDLFYFPVWWYTGGVKYIAFKCLNLFKAGNRYLSPGVWLINIAVPMYGQYDWQGRIVSFFMRLVQVIARTAALTVWMLFCLFLLMVWLLWPVFIFLGLRYSTKISAI